ncbi:MAG: hypothetical protein ABIZ49_14125 [Opitutaceae bacterium]
MAASSLLVPIAMLFVLAGMIWPSLFWASCLGVTLFCAFCLWRFSQLEKDACTHRTLNWIFGVVYFATVLAVVGRLFDSWKTAAVLAIAEAIGLVICLAGLAHAITVKENPRESSLNGDPPPLPHE